MSITKATLSADLNAHDVARYIVALDAARDEPDVTNLKLQKLLYFAQGSYLAATGRRLFTDTIQAWDHGPVVPNEYHHYKSAGQQIIATVLGADAPANVDVPEDAKNFLDQVWSKFAGMSASRLRNVSHEHSTWKQAIASGYNQPIRREDLRDFFLTEIHSSKRIDHEGVVLMSDDEWDELDATSDERVAAARAIFAA